MGSLRIFVFSISFLITGVVAAAAQTATPPNIDPATLRLIQDAAQKGVPLNSVSSVQDNVSVAAVLLPKSVSKVVFGKEIADKYAVIELTIANHNQDVPNY